MEALTLNNYSRASMATMLSALPREEQQWTRNFLDSIILVSSRHEGKKTAEHENSRKIAIQSLKGVMQLASPDKTLEQSMDYLKSLRVKGSKPVPVDIDDFGLFAEKYL